MPPLLLDANLSHALVDALSRDDIDVVHVANWDGGRWRTAPDDVLLTVAKGEGRVLVSLDAATLPAIARQWVEEDREHAGILILSPRINQKDVGGQAEAIRATLKRMTGQSWRNRVMYTQRAM